MEIIIIMDQIDASITSKTVRNHACSVVQQSLYEEEDDDDIDNWFALTSGRGRPPSSRFLIMVEELLDDLRAEESELEAQRMDALDEALEVMDRVLPWDA